MNATYLFPLTVIFLLIALGGLAFRAKTRSGYGPFFVGFLASGMIVIGKFVVGFDSAVYGGIALLVAASLWNGWPRKSRAPGICTDCLTAGTASK
jgi:hypothetical protein